MERFTCSGFCLKCLFSLHTFGAKNLGSFLPQSLDHFYLNLEANYQENVGDLKTKIEDIYWLPTIERVIL